MNTRQPVVPAALRQVVAETMAAASVPGIALLVAYRDQPAMSLYLGTDAGGTPLSDSSLFPVASVTKLATALAVLRLVDAGTLVLDDELALYLPEAVAAQSGVTLRKLLSHTAGLPPDVAPSLAPYAPGLNWSALSQACLETPLATTPDTVVQYGNVGYGLLALAVERATGLAFADALDQLVLHPLGIEAYLGTEPLRPVVQLAGVRSRHKGTELEPYNSRFWRSLALPWAGLVTTATGALSLLRAFTQKPPDFLKPDTAADAVRNQVGDLGGGQAPPLFWPRCPWGLGPELRGVKTPHWAPDTASPESFGHAGQSGCLVWNDTQAGVSWALHGAKTADSGWLIRQGVAIGRAIIAGGAT